MSAKGIQIIADAFRGAKAAPNPSTLIDDLKALPDFEDAFKNGTTDEWFATIKKSDEITDGMIKYLDPHTAQISAVSDYLAKVNYAALNQTTSSKLYDKAESMAQGNQALRRLAIRKIDGEIDALKPKEAAPTTPKAKLIDTPDDFLNHLKEQAGFTEAFQNGTTETWFKVAKLTRSIDPQTATKFAAFEGTITETSNALNKVDYLQEADLGAAIDKIAILSNNNTPLMDMVSKTSMKKYDDAVKKVESEKVAAQAKTIEDAEVEAAEAAKNLPRPKKPDRPVPSGEWNFDNIRTGKMRNIKDLGRGFQNQFSRFRRNVHAEYAFGGDTLPGPLPIPNLFQPRIWGKILTKSEEPTIVKDPRTWWQKRTKSVPKPKNTKDYRPRYERATQDIDKLDPNKVVLEHGPDLGRAGTARQFLNILHERMYKGLEPSFGLHKKDATLSPGQIKQNIDDLMTSLEEVQATLNDATTIENAIQRSALKNVPVIRRFKGAPHRIETRQINALQDYTAHQLERLKKISDELAAGGRVSDESIAEAHTMLDDIYTRFQRGYERFPDKPSTNQNAGTVMHEDREILARSIIEGLYSKHKRIQAIEVPNEKPANPEKYTLGSGGVLKFWNSHVASRGEVSATEMATLYIRLYESDHQSEFAWAIRRLYDKQGASASAIRDIEKQPVSNNQLVPDKLRSKTIEAYKEKYGFDPSTIVMQADGTSAYKDPHFMEGVEHTEAIRVERSPDHSPDEIEGERAARAYWEEKRSFFVTAARYPQGRISGISPAILTDYVNRPIRMWWTQNLAGLRVAPDAKTGEFSANSYKFQWFPGRHTIYDTHAQPKQARKWLGFGPKKVDADGAPVPLKRISLGTVPTMITNVLTLGIYSVWRPLFKVAAPVALSAFAIESLAGAVPDSWKESSWFIRAPTNITISVADKVADFSGDQVEMGLNWLNFSPASRITKSLIDGDGDYLKQATDWIVKAKYDYNGFDAPLEYTIAGITRTARLQDLNGDWLSTAEDLKIFNDLVDSTTDPNALIVTLIDGKFTRKDYESLGGVVPKKSDMGIDFEKVAAILRQQVGGAQEPLTAEECLSLQELGEADSSCPPAIRMEFQGVSMILQADANKDGIINSEDAEIFNVNNITDSFDRARLSYAMKIDVTKQETIAVITPEEYEYITDPDAQQPK